MDDFLNIICLNLGIKLIYNKNEFLVLSTEVKEDTPILRAHQVFKGCSSDLAQNIIDYYINEENTEVYERNIIEFTKSKLPSNTFKIKPLNIDFSNTVIKNFSTSSNIALGSTLIEHDIDSITTKDFLGSESKYSNNIPLMLSNSNILEVNIIVKPPVT